MARAGPTEDLSRFFKGLSPGTLQGVEALCDHDYWLSVLTSADIQIDNPNMLRLKFLQVNKQANTKIEFIAGSGDFATFSVRQLIGQIVDQAQENQRYTKSMEAYVAKMQGKLRQAQAELESLKASQQHTAAPHAPQQQQQQSYRPQQPSSSSDTHSGPAPALHGEMGHGSIHMQSAPAPHAQQHTQHPQAGTAGQSSHSSTVTFTFHTTPQQLQQPADQQHSQQQHQLRSFMQPASPPHVTTYKTMHGQQQELQ